MYDLTAFTALAERFETRAAERLAETPGDPAAHVLNFAAAQVREVVKALDSGDIWWKTDRAAQEAGCTVAAVQYWCKHAERLGLRVIQTPSREYRIHRDDVLSRGAALKARRERQAARQAAATETQTSAHSAPKTRKAS